ncbi:MAG: hypothetical protein FJ135_00180 [Deltaproteobacteria bacterium]|nr:hypothetical protein [Deltaproteobacteria bacterium]
MLTRTLDILCSLVGLSFLALIYPIVALMTKLDSKGPVFYKCSRVGLNGKIFQMYKFRTMHETQVSLGPSVSPLGDPRVTSAGRVLRRLKLNELPQVINILKGDMTLIGPRPEAPDLAAAYPPEARKIFTVKPGLAGPNQILGRNEEELYPPGVDATQYYIEHILPQKLPLDWHYIENKSFFTDLQYIFKAIWVVLTKAVGSRHLENNRSQLLLLVCDAIFCVLSFFLAHMVRFEGLSRTSYQQLYHIIPLAVLVRLPVFYYFGFYHTIIRHLSLFDIKQVIKGVAVSTILLISISFLFNFSRAYSRIVFFIDWCLLTTLLVSYRGLWKYLERRGESASGEEIRALIWGGGDCGELCFRFLAKERNPSYKVVGFIDDDPRKQGKTIQGVRILGDHHQLGLITELYQVDKVFIAIASAPDAALERTIQTCQGLGLEVEIFFTKNNSQLKGSAVNGAATIFPKSLAPSGVEVRS